MSKLHEILAVESQLATAHNTISEETKKVFDRGAAFIRVIEDVKYFADDDQKLNTTARTELTTTVKDRLAYSFGSAFTRHLDCMTQRDATNQKATADLVVGGKVVARNLPGVTLLSLEQKLRLKKEELEKIPVLQAGTVWHYDSQERLFKSEPVITFRTQKTLVPVVLYEATKEHPAQVKELPNDRQVAKISRTLFSGMVTSADKADYIARIDILIKACKEARQRANRTDVVKVHIGKALADFILGDTDPDSIVDSDVAD